jgi:hypothetical protein
VRFCTLTLLLLSCIGCTERPPKREPCEVWVNDYDRRVSYCVSHDRVTKDIAPAIVGPDQP